MSYAPGSVEFVQIEVFEARVPYTDADTIQYIVKPSKVVPDNADPDWADVAQQMGEYGFYTGPYGEGTWWVWVRVIAGAETPKLRVGSLRVR